MTVSRGQLGWTIVTTLIGLALAFLVAVSVFADGTWHERVVTMGVLVLGYGLAGALLGFWAPAWYGVGLALPGLIALALFSSGGEGDWWYVLYGILILTLAGGGAYGVRAIQAGGRARGG